MTRHQAVNLARGALVRALEGHGTPWCRGEQNRFFLSSWMIHMTFYEAAIEILKEAGRPLHYKKITEMAIRRDLLSHIGKTPEITMQARLNQEGRKGGESAITQIRPGVFALAEGVPLDDVKETITPASTTDVPGPPEPTSRRDDEGDSPWSGPAPGPVSASTAKSTRKRAANQDGGRASGGSAMHAASFPSTLGQDLSPLVAAATAVLHQTRQPLDSRELARLVSKAMQRVVPQMHLVKTIEEANRDRAKQGHRPLIVRHGDGWQLVDSLLGGQLVTIWDELESVLGRLVAETTRQLVKQIEGLSPQGRELVVVTLWQHLGYALTEVARDTSSVIFIATRAGEVATIPVRTALQVWLEPRTISDSEVAVFRGRLAHWEVTCGVMVVSEASQVESSARSEADGVSTLPIGLLTPEDLAPLAMGAGVGVSTHPIEAPLLDTSWFF